jgi:hypothetical protein
LDFAKVPGDAADYTEGGTLSGEESVPFS